MTSLFCGSIFVILRFDRKYARCLGDAATSLKNGTLELSNSLKCLRTPQTQTPRRPSRRIGPVELPARRGGRNHSGRSPLGGRWCPNGRPLLSATRADWPLRPARPTRHPVGDSLPAAAKGSLQPTQHAKPPIWGLDTLPTMWPEPSLAPGSAARDADGKWLRGQSPRPKQGSGFVELRRDRSPRTTTRPTELTCPPSPPPALAFIRLRLYGIRRRGEEAAPDFLPPRAWGGGLLTSRLRTPCRDSSFAAARSPPRHGVTESRSHGVTESRSHGVTESRSHGVTKSRSQPAAAKNLRPTKKPT